MRILEIELTDQQYDEIIDRVEAWNEDRVTPISPEQMATMYIVEQLTTKELETR